MPTFADPLFRAIQVAGDHTAVISEGRHFTFRELNSRCRRLAAVLKSKGAEPGDRVAVLAANTNHHLESYVAIPAAGFVIVPLNTRHAGPELDYAVKDAEVKILLTDRDPGALRELVETVVMIPDEYDALLEGADRIGARRRYHRRHPGRPVLHRRHDGCVERRDADAQEPDFK